ncbi:hypothetical protein MMC24_002602 [Lignoscripta atroalba]|nr:hypothetical protein [Lignoscripta atroalba]
MAPSVEISIPNAQISDTPKPYTVYNITLRLPLRSFVVQKRYSDFTALHTTLTSQAGSPPPAPLPQKSWFSRTTSNPALTEERRKGLETYLRTINTCDDLRWRNTSAWRTFLNLPSSTLSTKSSTATSTAASGLHSALTSSGPITDPVLWLDCHRELRTFLHDARLSLTRRDQQTQGSTTITTSPQAQHESSAHAKKCLVKAGSMIGALEQGLKRQQDEWGSEKLGEGEVRRRKDLISSAKKEREGLEGLLNAMAAKSRVDATVQDKQALLESSGTGLANGGAPNNHNHNHNQSNNSRRRQGGRVLGKETTQTRELDNQGVLQLQKQLMHEQDEDVLVLAKAVRRQRELGVAINEELEVQKVMLEMMDEDVTRVAGKIDVARKRVGKIS